MKSVNPEKYNKKYFLDRYQQNIDYDKISSLDDFEHIYKKSDLLPELNKNDHVIDLGCGVGSMAFYLCIKYGCRVTGIDYSLSAIQLCRENLWKLAAQEKYVFIKDKADFLLSNIDNLPNFSEIKAVFLVDVVEHLTDNELDAILEKIKSWSEKGTVKIVIHTDNNNYLKFIRPITDVVSVCMKKNTFKNIHKSKAEEREMHINLTTARRLSKKLRTHDFSVVNVKYPKIDKEIVRSHLGLIGRYPFVFYPIYLLGKIFYFLRPSFYLVAVSK